MALTGLDLGHPIRAGRWSRQFPLRPRYIYQISGRTPSLLGPRQYVGIRICSKLPRDTHVCAWEPCKPPLFRRLQLIVADLPFQALSGLTQISSNTRRHTMSSDAHQFESIVGARSWMCVSLGLLVQISARGDRRHALRGVCTQAVLTGAELMEMLVQEATPKMEVVDVENAHRGLLHHQEALLSCRRIVCHVDCAEPWWSSWAVTYQCNVPKLDAYNTMRL